MGYNSRFSVDIDVPKKDIRRVAIATEIVYGDVPLRELFNGGAPVWKWYDFDEDMRRVSAAHPGVLFTLTRNGEDDGDFERVFYRDGKAQTVRGVVHYPDFDPAKLA